MPGSALIWHDFRIIKTMYEEWKQKQQPGEEGEEGSVLGDDVPELKEDGGWQTPPPLKGSHKFSSLGGGGSET
jgi:hypothetical protein